MAAVKSDNFVTPPMMNAETSATRAARHVKGHARIAELRRSADTLDDRAQAEVWFTSAVTASEVGDDENALVAVEAIERLNGRINDPYLENALQLAVAWTRPIVDDFEGALEAASIALVGLRERNEPFVAFAALTVGMLEMTFGRDDAAHQYLDEVYELGNRFGNDWLTSTARTQLATLAVRAGRLDEARVLLLESLDAIEEAHPNTLSATFILVAFANLAIADADTRRAALALGAVDGLRKRSGLLAWPITRRDESELTARVVQAAGDTFNDAFAAGSDLHRREALALVRDGSARR